MKTVILNCNIIPQNCKLTEPKRLNSSVSICVFLWVTIQIALNICLCLDTTIFQLHWHIYIQANSCPLLRFNKLHSSRICHRDFTQEWSEKKNRRTAVTIAAINNMASYRHSCSNSIVCMCEWMSEYSDSRGASEKYQHFCCAALNRWKERLHEVVFIWPKNFNNFAHTVSDKLKHIY